MTFLLNPNNTYNPVGSSKFGMEQILIAIVWGILPPGLYPFPRTYSCRSHSGYFNLNVSLWPLCLIGSGEVQAREDDFTSDPHSFRQRMNTESEKFIAFKPVWFTGRQMRERKVFFGGIDIGGIPFTSPIDNENIGWR